MNKGQLKIDNAEMEICTGFNAKTLERKVAKGSGVFNRGEGRGGMGMMGQMITSVTLDSKCILLNVRWRSLTQSRDCADTRRGVYLTTLNAKSTWKDRTLHGAALIPKGGTELI